MGTCNKILEDASHGDTGTITPASPPDRVQGDLYFSGPFNGAKIVITSEADSVTGLPVAIISSGGGVYGGSVSPKHIDLVTAELTLEVFGGDSNTNITAIFCVA